MPTQNATRLPPTVRSVSVRKAAVCAGAHQSYEAEKYKWVSANPAATPDQYQAAMRRIAKFCGV